MGEIGLLIIVQNMVHRKFVPSLYLLHKDPRHAGLDMSHIQVGQVSVHHSHLAHLQQKE